MELLIGIVCFLIILLLICHLVRFLSNKKRIDNNNDNHIYQLEPPLPDKLIDINSIAESQSENITVRIPASDNTEKTVAHSTSKHKDLYRLKLISVGIDPDSVKNIKLPDNIIEFMKFIHSKTGNIPYLHGKILSLNPGKRQSIDTKDNRYDNAAKQKMVYILADKNSTYYHEKDCPHIAEFSLQLSLYDAINYTHYKECPLCIPKVLFEEKFSKTKPIVSFKPPTLSFIKLKYGGIPSKVELIEEDILEGDLLPVVKQRKYGYGKKYNAYITPKGQYYHNNRCPYLSKNKRLIHVYNAIMDKKLQPCTHCKPRKKLEKWYTEMFPHVSNTGAAP